MENAPTVFRTHKTWQIYSIVIGAAISFLPGVIALLVFVAKVPLAASVVLWFLTTAVMLEHWWWAEDVFRKLPNDSLLVMLIAFLNLMGLLSFPAVLLGADRDLPRTLVYYGSMFIVIAFLDILFCTCYVFAIRKTHPAEALKFPRHMITDGLSICMFGLWVGYVLPSTAGILKKSLLLAGVYFAFLIGEFVADYTYRKASALNSNSENLS